MRITDQEEKSIRISKVLTEVDNLKYVRDLIKADDRVLEYKLIESTLEYLGIMVWILSRGVVGYNHLSLEDLDRRVQPINNTAVYPRYQDALFHILSRSWNKLKALLDHPQELYKEQYYDLFASIARNYADVGRVYHANIR